MENKIHVLSVPLRNQIAAGEVVERPASVVKELVENAIDAGSRRIIVELEGSGLRLIRVSDDGEGMTPKDAVLSFERHATSKIATEFDLLGIRTMGFRGEALSSISAVSRVKMITATSTRGSGLEVRIEGGGPLAARETSGARGTLVEVADLFYNVPARRKFLKSPTTELSHVVRTVRRLSLGFPEIQFRLIHEGRTILEVPAGRDISERVLQLEGEAVYSEMIKLDRRDGGIRIHGVIGRPPHSAPSRDREEFLVNRRSISSPVLSRAATDGYASFSLKSRFPVVFLAIELDPTLLDVNVHPTKREVRFQDSSGIYQSVVKAIRGAISEFGFGSATGKAGVTVLSGVARSVAAETRDHYLSGPAMTTADIGAPGQPESEKGLFGQSDKDGRTEVLTRLLGQSQRSYLLAEVGSELHLIDQHAAHERLLFERLTRQLQAGPIPKQALLIPHTIQMAPDDLTLLVRLIPQLEKIGIEVEPFGGNSVVVRTVPSLLPDLDIDALVEAVASDEDIGAAAADRLFDELLASLACHGAVRANMALTQEAMGSLINDLYRENCPLTCPHGRPIRKIFSRADLEQFFYRR